MLDGAHRVSCFLSCNTPDLSTKHCSSKAPQINPRYHPVVKTTIIDLKCKSLSQSLDFPSINTSKRQAHVYDIFKMHSPWQLSVLSHFNCIFSDLIGFSPSVYRQLFEMLLRIATYNFFTISFCGLFIANRIKWNFQLSIPQDKKRNSQIFL